jgi:hypothetical protein
MNNIHLATMLLLALVAVCAGLALWKRTKNTRNMANAANAPSSGLSSNGEKTYLCGAVADWTTFTGAYTNTHQPPGRHALVVFGADSSHIRISGTAATDKPIGFCTDCPDATEDPVNVVLLSSGRTVLAVAAAAITLGDLVSSNGDGAVKTGGAGVAGWVVGRALQAAGAAGDVIEVMPFPTAVVAS